MKNKIISLLILMTTSIFTNAETIRLNKELIFQLDVDSVTNIFTDYYGESVYILTAIGDLYRTDWNGNVLSRENVSYRDACFDEDNSYYLYDIYVTDQNGDTIFDYSPYMTYSTYKVGDSTITVPRWYFDGLTKSGDIFYTSGHAFPIGFNGVSWSDGIFYFSPNEAWHGSYNTVAYGIFSAVKYWNEKLYVVYNTPSSNPGITIYNLNDLSDKINYQSDIDITGIAIVKGDMYTFSNNNHALYRLYDSKTDYSENKSLYDYVIINGKTHYGIDGRKIAADSSGLHIIRSDDGKVRKTLVK